ncbi:hypothetical protein KA183_07235 [bacterium]|nr:hypothetical protein [bacterium]
MKNQTFAMKNPDLVQEWHKELNGTINPKDVAAFSNKNFWWICSKNEGHIWETSPGKRTSGRGCPYCSNKKINFENSLAFLRPDVAKQWSMEKNKKLDPENVSVGSNKKVWWQCPKRKSHHWQASIVSRTVRPSTSCPFCSNKRIDEQNNLAKTHPQIASEWHKSLNLIKPSQVVAGSNKKVWWLCQKNKKHEWQTAVCSRTKKQNPTGCPYCCNQKVEFSNCLQFLRPDLIKEWDYQRNSISPTEVTTGSNRLIWWICSKGLDHAWKAKINKRANLGQGCPFCVGRKVSQTNSLKSLFPDIASELHPELNKGLLSHEVTAGSHKKLWWQCKKNQSHKWGSTVVDRTRQGSNCPYCSNKKVTYENCLASTFPKMAKEWHPTKNAPLTAFDVVAGSGKIVWWRCLEDKSHEWRVSIINRSRQISGCPNCSNKKLSKTNSLSVKFPELLKEWHPSKNGDLKPETIVFGSHIKIWWQCSKGFDHEWSTPLNKRTQGDKTGCPFCSNKKTSITNNLANLRPDIASQWHPSKNGLLTPTMVVFASHKKIWWKCEISDDHEWQTKIVDRTKLNGTGCPFCSGQKVSVTNSLATQFPKIAKYWHPSKNHLLTPSNVVAGSSKKIWWKCPKGPDHEWQAVLSNRIKSPKEGCPYCRALKPSVTNSLESCFPEIAKEFHPTRNSNLTAADVVYGSERKVWWQCKNNSLHEWSAMVLYRTKKAGRCPWCHNFINGKPVSQPQELLWRILGGILNLKVGKYWIDIALENENPKIAVEYDSWYWHKHLEKIEIERDKFLFEKGWSILRIRSNLKLPKQAQLVKAINQIRNGKQRVFITLNDWGKDR